MEWAIQAKERSSQDEGGAYRVPPEDYVANLRSLVGKVEKSGAKAVLFGYPLERTGIQNSIEDFG